MRKERTVMNSKNETTTTKQNRKRRLLPLVALVAGMCLPVYAWANPCMEACVAYCATVLNSQMEGCEYLEWTNPPAYQACLNAAYEEMARCSGLCWGWCGM
jgi:hypothetical protein